MSKQKSEIIFTKDVYKIDYVLEFCFVKTMTITMPNMNTRLSKSTFTINTNVTNMFSHNYMSLCKAHTVFSL